MDRLRPTPNRFLESRAHFFEEAVREAPEHIRYVLLHHPDAEKIQGVVLGIKPMADAFGVDAEELSKFLNSAAGQALFIHANDRIGNPVAVKHIVGHHPEAFRDNLEVRSAETQKRDIDPARVIEQISGHEQAGILYGFPGESSRQYAKVEKRDSSGIFWYLISKRLERAGADQKAADAYKNLTADDFEKNRERFNGIRERAMAAVKRQVRAIIENPRPDELKHLGTLFGNRLPKPEDYFEEAIRPKIFDFVWSGNPYFGYGQALHDHEGFKQLRRMKEPIEIVNFRERVENLKGEYPAPPEDRSGKFLNQIIAEIKARTTPKP